MQIVVGFAAETENVLENARQKLVSKNLDAIVVNDVSREGVGFDSDRNAVTIITRDEVVEVPETTKWEVAQRVLDQVVKLRGNRKSLLKRRSDHWRTPPPLAAKAPFLTFDPSKQRMISRKSTVPIIAQSAIPICAALWPTESVTTTNSAYMTSIAASAARPPLHRPLLRLSRNPHLVPSRNCERKCLQENPR